MRWCGIFILQDTFKKHNIGKISHHPFPLILHILHYFLFFWVAHTFCISALCHTLPSICIISPQLWSILSLGHINHQRPKRTNHSLCYQLKNLHLEESTERRRQSMLMSSSKFKKKQQQKTPRIWRFHISLFKCKSTFMSEVPICLKETFPYNFSYPITHSISTGCLTSVCCTRLLPYSNIVTMMTSITSQ